MDRIDLLASYTKARKRLIKLHDPAVKGLTRGEVEDAARHLGIFQEPNVFVLDSEDEMSVLMDFALYELRRDSIPIIECCLREHPLSHREAALADAIRSAFTSLFCIEEIGLDGLKLVDVLASAHLSLNLVDIAF